MATNMVHGQLAHFSINADDVDRARNFYSNVFGWGFEAYGPPGFFMVSFPASSTVPALGSLQGRRALIADTRMNGFECTIAVDDVEETSRRIEANGGKVIMVRTTLPGVGHLIFFQDPEGNIVGAMQEGNIVGAMQYDTEAR